jgi:DNA-binding MarR family transcriptional regulator
MGGYLYATYTMTTDAPGTRAPEAPAPLDEPLSRLDAALIRLRRFWERPGVRAALRTRLQPEVDGTAYRALSAIERQPDASVGTVAELLEVDASTASRIVDRAVEGGHVQRTTSPVDRRRCTLQLTASGRTALAGLRAARLDLLAELTAGWADQDVRRLDELLERLDDACLQLEHP